MRKENLDFYNNMTTAMARVTKDKTDRLALELILKYLDKHELLDSVNKSLLLKNVKRYNVVFERIDKDTTGIFDHIYKVIYIDKTWLVTRVHEMLHFLFSDEVSQEDKMKNEKFALRRKEAKKYKNKKYVSGFSNLTMRFRREIYRSIVKNEAFVDDMVDGEIEFMSIDEGMTETLSKLICKDYYKEPSANVTCYLSYISLTNQLYGIYGKKFVESYLSLGLESLFKKLDPHSREKIKDICHAFDYYEDDCVEAVSSKQIANRYTRLVYAQMETTKLLEAKLKREIEETSHHFKMPRQLYSALAQTFVDFSKHYYFGEDYPLENGIAQTRLWKQFYSSYCKCCEKVDEMFGYGQSTMDFEELKKRAVIHNVCLYGEIDKLEEITLKDKIGIENLQVLTTDSLEKLYSSKNKQLDEKSENLFIF